MLSTNTLDNTVSNRTAVRHYSFGKALSSFKTLVTETSSEQNIGVLVVTFYYTTGAQPRRPIDPVIASLTKCSEIIFNF